MSFFRSEKGFLYYWIDFETQPIVPMREGLRLESIRHVLENTPSILRDIASFSTGRGYVPE